MNPKRPLLPLNQPRKPPIAPAVYRPQPNPVCVQRKTITSTQPRTTPSAPPVYRPTQPKVLVVKPQSAIQPKQNPKAPPVYKPAPPKVQQLKPSRPPAFSQAAAPRGLVQAKSRNGTQVKAPVVNGLPRVANQQRTTFFRTRAIQLRPIGNLGDWYVRRPNGDEQEEVHKMCAQMLAPHAHEHVDDDDLIEARVEIASRLLEKFGGADNFQTRMVTYFLGLRQNAPAARVTGMGTLAFSAAGVTGRPGFLRASFGADQITGAPGRAFRHKTAWHNIRTILNRVLGQFGPGRLEEIFDRISPRVPPEINAEANQVLQNVEGLSATAHKVLWLAIVLNSSPGNLWLGPAKENISINSSGAHLRRWTQELDSEELDLDEYRAKVRNAKFGSPKAQKAQREVLQIIRDAAGTADPVTFVVNNVFHHCIRMLEVDLKDESELYDRPHHMQIFQIAHGVGDLGHHERLIEGLLGL